MDAVREHKRESKNAKSNHDRRKNKRLGDWIGKRTGHSGLPFRDNRGPCPRKSSRCKDQEIRAVAQKSEPNDQLGEPAPQDEIETGSVQRACRNRK
jgi:hypothetical protein